MKTRILCVVLTLCMVLTMMPLTASAASKTWDMAMLEGYYKTQGRVDLNGTVFEMDTTGSGFEFYFDGSGDVKMSAQIRCTYSTDLYLTVIVDGVRTRMQLDAGTKGINVNKTVTLASGLADGIHHIEVYKQTEAIISRMQVASVTFNGTPLATPPADKITIEVVGDSISAGASMWSTSSDQSINADYPVFIDGTKSYAYLTGEALGGNIRVTQASGYGCVSGFNTDGINLQQLYPYTNYWRDSDLYEFDPPADLVIINLGTNDYQSAGITGLTEAGFKEGALNLLAMVREKNPASKIVWCTGMMGVAFPGALPQVIAQAGGAAQGYYYCELPYGADGGYAHPNVAQHATAADVLIDFIKTNMLPADYTDDFANVTALQSALQSAKNVSAPSAALQSAIKWAQAELAWGTTDPYRLGVRVKALQDAMVGATKVDVMPRQYIAKTPMESNGSYIWPYYGATDGSVTLYKGGEGYYWPHITTLTTPRTVNINETPYLYCANNGNAYWNVHIQYKDTAGAVQTVTAATLNNQTEDFAAGEYDTHFDFAAYIRQNGHADANGNVVLTSINIFTAGETDTHTTWNTCAFVSGKQASPSTISGQYVIQNDVLCDVAASTTAAELIGSMDHATYLSVVTADGTAVSGKVATGMKLRLTVNGAVVDEVTIAVLGDVNEDGVSDTLDAREILMNVLGVETFLAVQTEAADYDQSGVVQSADVRELLMAIVNQ